MATLQKIRNRANLVAIVLGIALLAFVMGGLFSSGRSFYNKFKDKMFEVDGVKVSSKEYFARVNECQEAQKILSGNSSLREGEDNKIREQVYQQMVKEILLDKQAKKLGLTVGKEELASLLYGNRPSPVLSQLPLFINPKTKAYDKTILINFLQTLNTDVKKLSPQQRQQISVYRSLWHFIENLIKYEQLENKYYSLVGALIGDNDLQAAETVKSNNISAKIDYVHQGFSSIADSTINVSNDEIKKLYEKRKKLLVSYAPIAKVSYLVKEVVPSEEDFLSVKQEADQAAQKLKESTDPALIVSDYSDVPYRDVFVSKEFMNPEELNFVNTSSIGNVYGPVQQGNSYVVYKYIAQTNAPDSAFISMISIPDGENPKLAEHIADSLQSVIKSGTSFAEVANLQMPSQDKGGEVGWVREADLYSAGANIASSVFSAKPGEVLNFSVPGQKLLVSVSKFSTSIPKYKIAVVRMPVSIGESTQNTIDSQLNNLVNRKDITRDFVKVAEKEGYQVDSSAYVSASAIALNNLPSSRSIINWIFNNKAGDIKKFDISNYRVVMLIDKIYPQGYLPYEQVEKSLKNEIIENKKAEIIIKKLKDQKLGTLQEYASAMGSNIDTLSAVNFNSNQLPNLGFEPYINAYSQFAPLDKVGGPYKDDSGVIVLSTKERSEKADSMTAQQIKQMLEANNRYRARIQVAKVLMEHAKIVDYRYKFY